MPGRHIVAVILLVVSVITISFTLYRVMVLDKDANVAIISMGAANAVLGVLLLQTANAKSD